MRERARVGAKWKGRLGRGKRPDGCRILCLESPLAAATTLALAPKQIRAHLRLRKRIPSRAHTHANNKKVGYYKATKAPGPDGKVVGKRLLKMAPLHHHLELSGWKETDVVGVFYAVAVAGAALAAGLKVA